MKTKPKIYAIAIPGDGLLQGDCMGLLFCYSGPDSDLGVDEIQLFNNLDEANALIAILRGLKGLHPATMARFNAAWAEDTTGQDLVALSVAVHRQPQPDFDKKEAERQGWKL